MPVTAAITGKSHQRDRDKEEQEPEIMIFFFPVEANESRTDTGSMFRDSCYMPPLGQSSPLDPTLNWSSHRLRLDEQHDTSLLSKVLPNAPRIQY